MVTKLQQAAAAKTAAKGAPKKEPGTEVALKKETQLALTGIDMEADAGLGMEGADKDSFALPFLVVLQGLSPQLKTLDGARPGQIFNTVTNELSKELYVVPVAYQRRYNRWLPREQGGGFKGTMTVGEVEELQAAGKAHLEKDAKGVERLVYDGTELKDTRNHFVLVVDEEGGAKPALISMASTQIKRSRRWMSLIQNFEKTGANGRKFNPPSFACIYRVTTESESNNKGEWESFNIEFDREVDDPQLYQQAKAFHAQVVAGSVQVAPPPEDGDSDSGKF